MPQAILEIQDEVNVRFLGIPKNLILDAQNEVSYYVPGFTHMPAYKAGAWDGKIRLLSVTGKTYLNLLDDILPLFESDGYEFVVEDYRHDWSHITDNIEFPEDTIFSDYTWADGTPVVLRDYQLAGVHAAIENGSGLLEMATGSGKTLTCAAISKVYANYGNVVVIVPNIDLAIQTHALFKMLGLDPGLWYGEMKDFRKITISTWQSLDHVPELFTDVVCCIVDEAHQAKAKTLSEILSGPGANVPFRFGCTGTVPKEDIWRQQIKGILGSIIFTLKSWELQRINTLASAEIIQIIFEDSKNKEYRRDSSSFEDWSDQINWFFSNKERVDIMAAIIQDFADNEGNVLQLIPYKKHGKALHEKLPTSISVDGDDRGNKRMKIYDEFNQDDNGILLATFGVASTGIDIPRIYVLGFTEPGKKFEKIIQTIGRGLRKANDKDHVFIIDFCSDSGFSKKHADARRRLYKEAKIPYTMEYINYANS